MRCSTKGLCLPVIVLVAGCLAAGCGSAAQSAIGNLPSRTATTSATPGVTSTATTTATATSTETATSTATATVTATATPSAPATTPGQATTPAPTTSPSATGSGSSLLWLWILLGLAVLAGLIALITHSARRRSAAAAGWQSRLIDAYSKGSALHDAMSVAETPGELASGNASARWADIQRRADDLAQALYSLREAVPDDGDRSRIENTLTSLQAVRSAMDAERAQGGADPRQAEVVRNRLGSFEMSLQALREGGQGYH
jgi:hypothetical protein